MDLQMPKDSSSEIPKVKQMVKLMPKDSMKDLNLEIPKD